MDNKEQSMFSESFRGNDFTREFLNEVKWTRQIMVVIMFTMIWPDPWRECKNHYNTLLKYTFRYIKTASANPYKTNSLLNMYFT